MERGEASAQNPGSRMNPAGNTSFIPAVWVKVWSRLVLSRWKTELEMEPLDPRRGVFH